MLMITPEAKQWIKSQLTEAHAPDGFALRLFEEDGQVLMAAAQPEEEDQTFIVEEHTYLAVEPTAAQKLDGKALCCRETEDGACLAIAPANN